MDPSAKQILENLYGLMMEINFNRSKEDVLAELDAKPDPEIERHLIRIKQLSAKASAEATKRRYQSAMEQIAVLRKKGLDEIKKLLQPEDQAQLVPLFRKFEELTKEDEASILEDQELLHLIEIIKKRLDEDTKH